jgi:hypothetical protein
MTTKSGRYFANPALGRAHERSEASDRPAPEKKAPERGAEAPGERPEHSGGAHSVHIFKDEAGGHHVAAHHPHGVEHSDHGSLDEAMDHARGEMEGAHEQGGEGEQPESGAPEGLMSTLGGGSY